MFALTMKLNSFMFLKNKKGNMKFYPTSKENKMKKQRGKESKNLNQKCRMEMLTINPNQMGNKIMLILR